MLETKRLFLRPPILEDFEAFCFAQASPEFKKYTGGVMNKEKAQEEFRLWLEFWQDYNYCFYSVIEKSSNEWIGRIGPTRRSNDSFQEIGWSIIISAQGKGYAFEAVKAIIFQMQEKRNWNNIIFRIGCANLASQKLAIKLGAVNIGPEDFSDKSENAIEIWQFAK